MSAFFASGRVVDLVIAVMITEAVYVGWRRRDRLGEVVLALLPGLYLLLALRAALTGAGWQWVAIWITASAPAHILDMRRRLS